MTGLITRQPRSFIAPKFFCSMRASSGISFATHSGSGSVIGGIFSPRLGFESSIGSKNLLICAGGVKFNSIKSFLRIIAAVWSFLQSSRNFLQIRAACSPSAGKVLQKSIASGTKKICSTPFDDITSENAPPSAEIESKRKFPAS